MTDIVASELCSAGLPETAKAYVAWCREAERRTAEAKAVVATCGRRDPGIPREASAMGVGAASRDGEVAGLRAELAGMTRTCEITLDTNGRLMAENAALHTEVTRLGVGLRQAEEALDRERRRRQELAQPMTICVDQGNYLEWIGQVPYPLRERIEAALAKAPKPPPVLPTSSNPEHVRWVADVLRANYGFALNWEHMARLVLDVLPKLVGK